MDVRSCYAGPLSEVGDQVRRTPDAGLCRAALRAGMQAALRAQVGMDVVHHQTLYHLHRRVNPKDTIVGWCAPLPQPSRARARAPAVVQQRPPAGTV